MPRHVGPDGPLGVKVTFRLTDPETSDLDTLRGHQSRSEFFRALLAAEKKRTATRRKAEPARD